MQWAAQRRADEARRGDQRRHKGGVTFVRAVSPQTSTPFVGASAAAMSKQPVRVVIRNRPTQESADNIMLEKDGKTVTIRQSTATVGGGAKQARQQPLSV